MGKISEMPLASSITGQELIEVIQSGINKRLPVSFILEISKSAYQTALDNGFSGTEAQWLASLKGQDGVEGPAGPQGPQGIQGPQGLSGPQGPIGPKGNTGDMGPVGQQGLKGDKGDTGSQGPVGLTGPTGQSGVNGVNGKSAYEIAISNGFSGTEVEWLASLASVGSTPTIIDGGTF